MAIANLTRAVSLAIDSDYVGLPVSHNISNDGYWYVYHPAVGANNQLLGNSCTFYDWDSVLPIVSADRLSGYTNRVELDGTIAFIDEYQSGSAAGSTNGLANQTNLNEDATTDDGAVQARYHGGCIIRIGSGINDITAQNENDAFFFAHLGSFGDNNTSKTGSSPSGGSLEDDAFYWDRLYQATPGGDWGYYQYHKHLPSNYNKYDDGRLVMDGDGFIRPSDKQFGYLITIRATQAGNSYSVPLARIHTPSVGGAHNSHNDVTLPNVSGVNYLPGGILKGSSNRFHAFYLTEGTADSDWSVYSRTYTSSSGAFTPEVSYGDFPLANATFSPYVNGDQNYEGQQSKFALRASVGHTFGSKVYVPVIMKAIARTYSMEVEAIVGGGVVYQIGNNDRSGTYTGRQQPTIYLKVGDTLQIENNEYLAHPLYIKTSATLGTGNQVSASQGTVTGAGTQFVNYTPLQTGTYYYVCSVHSGMYGQIIVTALDGTFDQQVWNVTDANTISPGTLSRVDLPQPFQGTDYRPDIYLTSVGSRMYAAVGGSSWEGGVQLYSTTTGDSVGSWNLEGNIVTNGSGNPIRVHGFKYNANNTKFFTLLSGGTSNTGNYIGKGLYSFDLAGGAFDGYNHLGYNTNGFYETKRPLTAGFIRYDQSSGTLTSETGTEPEGISAGTSILQYDVASPNFYNRKEINTGAEEYFFQGVYLQDGRKCLVGRVENWFEDGISQIDGDVNSGDLIMTIVDNKNNSVSYVAGGTGDDFLTGVIEDVENDRIVFSGYAKGELTPKGEQWVHGWGRNVRQNADSSAMRFTDIVLDSDGYIVSGIDDITNHSMLFRYDKNYNLTMSKYISQGTDSSGIVSIDKFSDNSYVVSGYTHNATTKRDAYMAKLDSNDVVEWAYRFNEADNTNFHNFRSHCIVSNNGTEYIVAYSSNNTPSSDSDNPSVEFSAHRGGVLSVIDKDGTIITAKSTYDVTVRTDVSIVRLRPGRPDTGEFLFAGTSSYGGSYKTPAWGFGNINTTNLIKLAHYPIPSLKASVSGFLAQYEDKSQYKDIRLVNYDSDLSKYEIVVTGKIENLNASAPVPLATKFSFIDSTSYTVNTEWTNSYTSHYGTLNEFTSCLLEDSDQRDWWFFENEFFHNNQKRLIVTGTGVDLDSDAVHPDYVADILGNNDTFVLLLNDSDGSVEWHNSLGHQGNDRINSGICWDAHDRNFVTVGSSTSHSNGEDGVLFRLWKDGFGQGVYHTSASTSNAYYYDSVGINPSTTPSHYTNSSNIDTVSYPTLGTATWNRSTLSSSALDQTVLSTEYNGSYGANGLFTAFLGWVDKKDLQSFKNTDTFIERTQDGKIIHRADNIFNIRQISTVGDATADDGNVFGYDIIKSDDGEYYYMACQTSGNIALQNTGLSGVYDYMIAQYDIAADQFRFWQNGTADDEEIYALTELKGTARLVQNPRATNQGATNGVVSWTPAETGNYFYQCGVHEAMYGQITVLADLGSPVTYNITVDDWDPINAYKFTGSDRNGTINSSYQNSTITLRVGDTVNFTINNLPEHPFYIQTSQGSGGSKQGQIAFCGRSTGNLGGHTNIGGYDLFLGIFDPEAWQAEYYQMGSGFNDKAMNIHDLHPKIPDTLCLVYTTFGSVNGATTYGSEDIGVITFNYDSDRWGTGYNIGSETSEEIDQNGKPSTLLGDGRVAIVCNTSGAFADDANTFGLLDIGLGIFDFDSDGSGNYKGWKKYQVGSGSSDFSYSIDNNGSSFLISGYSEATWDKSVSGIFVEFDPERNILAKRAG